MEEQIKKLQEELELVKKERDNLILVNNKTFINTRLKFAVGNYTREDVKEELVNKNYINAIYKSYNTQIIQELINDYGYDLVVECMVELFLTEEEEDV